MDIISPASNQALLQQKIQKNQTRYKEINLKKTPPDNEKCAWYQKTSVRQAIALASAVHSLFFSGAAYYSYFYMVALPTTIQYTFYATVGFSSGFALLAIIALVIAKNFPSLNDPKERQKIRDQMDLEKLKLLSYSQMRALYPRKDVLTDAEINALLGVDVSNLSYLQFTEKHLPSHVLDILDSDNKEILLEKLMEQIQAEIQNDKVETVFTKYEHVLNNLSKADEIAKLKDRFQYEQLRDLSLANEAADEESCKKFLQEKGVEVLERLKNDLPTKTAFFNKLKKEILQANLGIAEIEQDAIYKPALTYFHETLSSKLFHEIIERHIASIKTKQMNYATFRTKNGLPGIKKAASLENTQNKQILISSFLNLDPSLIIQDAYADDRLALFGHEQAIQSIWVALLNKLAESPIPVPPWVGEAIRKEFLAAANLESIYLKPVLKAGLISSAQQNPTIFELEIILPTSSNVLGALEKEIIHFNKFDDLCQNCPQVLFDKKFLTKQSPHLTGLVSTYVFENLSSFIGLVSTENTHCELIEDYGLMNDPLATNIAKWKVFVEQHKKNLGQLSQAAATQIKQEEERYDKALEKPKTDLEQAEQNNLKLEQARVEKKAAYAENEKKLDVLKSKVLKLELEIAGLNSNGGLSDKELTAYANDKLKIKANLDTAQQELQTTRETLQKLQIDNDINTNDKTTLEKQQAALIQKTTALSNKFKIAELASEIQAQKTENTRLSDSLTEDQENINRMDLRLTNQKKQILQLKNELEKTISEENARTQEVINTIQSNLDAQRNALQMTFEKQLVAMINNFTGNTVQISIKK